MPVTFGGKQCVEPAGLRRRCLEVGLDTSWFGLPNSYACPRGGSPGYGWVLLRLPDLESLLEEDVPDPKPEEERDFKFFDLEFASNSVTGAARLRETATVKNLVLVRGDCVTPGARDGESVYLCLVADRRYYLERYQLEHNVFTASFNLRHLRSGIYIPETLNFATSPRRPWTWDEMINHVWNSARNIGNFLNLLGDYPGLPYEPKRDPESVVLEGMYVAEALDRVLSVINCALAWDPVADRFRIALAGQADSAFDAALGALEGRRVWDSYRKRGVKTEVPREVVYGLRRRGWVRRETMATVRGQSPFYFDSSRSGPWARLPYRNPRYEQHFHPPFPIPQERMWPATVLNWGLDLEHDWDPGALPMSAERQAYFRERTDQLTPLIFDSLEAAARGLHVVYPFALADAGLMPGPQVSRVRWAETGAGYAPHSGLVTEVWGNVPVVSPPFEPATLDPPGVMVALCTGTTPDASGLYPGVLGVWARSETPGGGNTVPGGAWLTAQAQAPLVTVKLLSINGVPPVAGDRYVAVYQSRDRGPAPDPPFGEHPDPADATPGIWAIKPVPPPPA